MKTGFMPALSGKKPLGGSASGASLSDQLYLSYLTGDKFPDLIPLDRLFHFWKRILVRIGEILQRSHQGILISFRFKFFFIKVKSLL